ncbi:hypothetical protein [Streptomyces minutiscleroticus]|uniref:hypothetical protein n=1 Tax=Streptomyces minutiscleroticus TaxID=68238 RepID=UPI003328C378
MSEHDERHGPRDRHEHGGDEHGRDERRYAAGRHGEEHEQQAGNGTVNHGPSDRPGSGEPGEPGRTDASTDTGEGGSGAAADRDAADAGGRSAASAVPGTSDPTAPAASEPSAPTTPTASGTSGSTAADTSAASGSAASDVPETVALPRAGGSEASGSTASDVPETVTLPAADVPAASGSAASDVPETVALPAVGGSKASGGSGTSGGAGAGDTDGPGLDELALRRLLHQAVDEIEPTDGTLEHLRRAVPARRARKRQAAVGMAAAALFIGTAVPALLHVSQATGPNADPSIAANSERTKDEGGKAEEAADGGSKSDASSEKSDGGGKDGKKEKKDRESGASSGATSGADPSTTSASAPACTPVQLGSATANVGAPDAAGAVYGSFRVANVSSASCTVTGPGAVTVAPQGAADGSQVHAARHVAGDAAAGLPDPSTESGTLVLVPGAAYEVKFAWVPSQTCPSTGGGGDGEPVPDPSPTNPPVEGGDDTASEGDNTMSTQLMRQDGTLDGSVAVSHTAQGGAPTATTTVSNACAGSVYYTGVLATS